MNPYPENIYATSVDPMHYSHLNTLKLAEKTLGEKVTLLICKNDLKTNQLFSIEEREKIAKLFLPSDQIATAQNYNEIKAYLLNAKKIIRGIRNSEDIQYTHKLAKYYQVDQHAYYEKLLQILVPLQYKKMSSSELKRLVENGDFLEAEKITLPEIIELIKAKCFCSNLVLPSNIFQTLG